MKKDISTVSRKIIPLIAIMGSIGGTTASVMEWAESSVSYFIVGICVLLYAIFGTFVGFYTVKIFKQHGKDIINRNYKGELLLIKQPIYWISFAAMVFAFLTNMKTGIGVGFLGSIFYGFTFLLGLSNGIFDYRESVTKNLLIAPIVPIGFSFIYGYYIKGGNAASGMAWFFGSIYLFSYLLFLNRMHLNSKIFSRKAVNVEDSKKIRLFNDGIIVSFYLVYLLLFNLRKVLNVSYNAILAFFVWLLMIMSKLTEWLLSDIPKEGMIDPLEKEKPDYWPNAKRPWLELLLKIIMYVVVGAVVVAAIISLTLLIIRTIKKIREMFLRNYNKSVKEKKIEYAEYEEENDIIREEKNKANLKSNKKKLTYSLKKLNSIPIAADKIKYIYGFVLERLYYKQINIVESDTPEEILVKVKKSRNGKRLAEIGFEEFTDKYRQARYSNKEIREEEGIIETGKKFERAVSQISSGKENDEV